MMTELEEENTSVNKEEIQTKCAVSSIKKKKD